jgi:hypothetical protein
MHSPIKKNVKKYPTLNTESFDKISELITESPAKEKES